jgi:uncharacterized membrane protein YhaH (DUF805 family)
MGKEMKWMLMPLTRFFEFEGRSRRKEFWMFTLLTYILYFACIAMMIVGMTTMNEEGDWNTMSALGLSLFGLTFMVLLIPTLAVQARRFHDQDRSGWFVLLNLIPSAGPAIILIFMCLEGTRGSNRFGPDPKG